MIDLKSHHHFHFIGIGGIGMSALAEILLTRGYTVSGSDMNTSAITEHLSSLGANIFRGHQASNIAGADAVIYTAAISPENPELLEASSLGIPSYSRAELLGSLMSEYPNSIAISGTHGKTTTSSMLSLILENAHMDPTILVGGNLPQINGNVKIGKGPFFVTEACEYMDSFLSMRPMVEIILNIDSDHLDYFKDIDHITRSFDAFASLVPSEGLVIAYAANAFVAGIINKLNCRVITFGFDPGCDYRAEHIHFNNFGMPSFDLLYKGAYLTSIQLAIPGEHNVSNALASFACAHQLGAPVESIRETLESFSGTQRRFDILGVMKDHIKIVDDYAHHPTEIQATLRAAANIPHRQLWCLFQPHTYTRTLALFDDFSDAFQQADHIVLAEIYAAREKNIYKISSRDLAASIKSRHPEKNVYYFKTFPEIADFVRAHAKEEDLILTMGAGDIYKVAEMLLEH